VEYQVGNDLLKLTSTNTDQSGESLTVIISEDTCTHRPQNDNDTCIACV